jgi:hypothetical protein
MRVIVDVGGRAEGLVNESLDRHRGSCLAGAVIVIGRKGEEVAGNASEWALADDPACHREISVPESCPESL